MKKHLSGLGAFLLTVLCVCSVGSTQDKSKEAAAHFKKGVTLFNENKKDEAVLEFNTAYEIKPSWKIMYNIGQCHASLKRYGLAIEAFEKYLGEGGDEVPQDRQDEVLAELDRLRKMVGSIKVHGPDGVEIYIDKILRGTTPMSSSILDTAGVEHWIWLVKDGKKLLSVQETLRGGEVLELTAPSDDEAAPAAAAVGDGTAGAPAAGPAIAPTTTPPGDATSGQVTASPAAPTTSPATPAASTDTAVSPPPPSTDKTPEKQPDQNTGRKKLGPGLFIAGAVVAVVFGGATGALAGVANSKWEKSENKIKNDPWQTDTSAVSDNIRTMHILGYVSLGLAAAGVITAAVTIPFTNWKKNKSEKAAAVTAAPWADGQSGGLVIEGRF